MTLIADRPVAAARPDSVGAVWRPLAHREARFMLRHPLFLAAVVASLFLMWSFNRGQLPHLDGYSTYVGLGLAPVAGAALLIAHLQVTRARLHNTLEIEDTTAATKRSRVFGHLVGALGAVPVAAVIVVAYMAYLLAIGGTGSPDVGELVVGPVVVALGATMGVAVGTWFPNRFSGLIGLAVLAGVQIALQDASGTTHWFAWWHTVLWYGGFDLWIRPTWAHAGYVAGIALLLGAIATFRNGVSAKAGGVAAVAVALVLGGAAVQIQPPDVVAVEERVDRITDPQQHWLSVAGVGADYRIHQSYERWVQWWDQALVATLAPIPAQHRVELRVEQWHHPFPSQIIDEFGRADPTGIELVERANDLFNRGNAGDPSALKVGDILYLADRSGLAAAAAQRAVGLPLVPVPVEGSPYTEEEVAFFNREPSNPNEFVAWPGRELGLPPPQAGDRRVLHLPCRAEGQAREVVGSWLAAQGSPELADRYAQIRARGAAFNEGSSDFVSEFQLNDGPVVRAVHWAVLGWLRSEAVLGSPTATDLAAQLLERPPNEVAATISDHWAAWMDPSATVDEVVAAFGLQPAPTPTEWIERAGLDPGDFAESIAAYPLWVGDDLPEDQPYPTCQ